MWVVHRKTYANAKLRWRSVFSTLLLSLVVVVIVNLTAWQYLQKYPVNLGVTRVWQKWQMIERQVSPVDWLILGDSTCGQGIMPVEIEAVTGQSALNLCTIANASAVNGVWQLEHYLERVGTPQKVILFHAFHVWERGPDDLIAMFDQIPLEQGFHRRLSPPLHLGFFRELEILSRPFRTLFISNLSISFILKREISALLKGKSLVRSDALYDLEFVIRHKGYVGSNTPRPDRVIAQSRSSAISYASREFYITPDNEAALRAACDLAKRHNFKVYLANSSISRILYQDAGFQSFYKKMVNRLANISDECPEMEYIMQVPAQFDPEEMDNEDHVVTDEIAARLTNILIREVEAAEQTTQ